MVSNRDWEYTLIEENNKNKIPTCTLIMFLFVSLNIYNEKQENTIIPTNIYLKKIDNKMKKLILAFIVCVVSTYSLYSQNKIIKGRVMSDHFETGSLVTIMINDTAKVGSTDFDGFFQIDIPVSVNKISFWSVGMETTTINLVDKCDELEVVMMLSCTYDFMTLKKVDRLRKKQFDKLPELHKEAFEKGIFKTDKPCYIQEFKPYYKKKPK